MRQPDWRGPLELAVARALEFLEALPQRPVAPRASAEAVRSSLTRGMPEGPSDPRAVVDELARLCDPGLTAMPSGRFFGWVIGGALPAPLAADWLTSIWDQNAGSAEGTPAAAAVEEVVLRWIVELLAIPPGSSGALVTGGQAANTVGLAAARHAVLAAHGWDVEADGLVGAPAITVVVGDERHDTIPRSLRLLGLGERRVRVVPADAQGRLRSDALEHALAQLDGPVIVCAQVGNVNSGALDPIGAIADVVARRRERTAALGPTGGTWLHVDGAFGLWGRTSARLASALAGLERADSWATDAHKWLNTPYDCGIALVAHPEAHRRAMQVQAAYLPDSSASPVRNPFDYTPELSRRARGFVLWAALRQLGRSGVTDLVDRSCALARRFADRLGAAHGVEILNEIVLNQVLVRFGNDDDHTRAVVQRVKEGGICFTSGTVWHGRAAMRISVSNWSTDEADVDRSVDAILEAHRALPAR